LGLDESKQPFPSSLDNITHNSSRYLPEDINPFFSSHAALVQPGTGSTS
jgi:hypothetical protein